MARSALTRDRILALIKLSTVALSHTEIQDALNGADRITVYRSLKWLVARKLIYRIVNVDGSAKYAVSCQHTGRNTGKIHFSCINCKTVICLDNVSAEFNLPEEYKVIDMNFILSGLCPQCLQQ